MNRFFLEDYMLGKHKTATMWHIIPDDETGKTLCGKQTDGFEFIDVTLQQENLCKSCKSLLHKQNKKDKKNEPAKPDKRRSPVATW